MLWVKFFLFLFVNSVLMSYSKFSEDIDRAVRIVCAIPQE